MVSADGFCLRFILDRCPSLVKIFQHDQSQQFCGTLTKPDCVKASLCLKTASTLGTSDVQSLGIFTGLLPFRGHSTNGWPTTAGCCWEHGMIRLSGSEDELALQGGPAWSVELGQFGQLVRDSQDQTSTKAKVVTSPRCCEHPNLFGCQTQESLRLLPRHR